MAGRLIPDKITQLSRCEIFVFGSNLGGRHTGGAARTAHRHFGAQWGVGVGPAGQTYAIPTTHGGVDDIKPFVDDFIEYARQHPDNRFLVTRIGCGVAGFSDEEIAPLFADAKNLPNVNFSKEWLDILFNDEFVDAVLFGIIPKEEIVPVPAAVNEKDLIELSRKYKYIIGSGVKAPLPDIMVRYVIDRDKFGYAKFGNFILTDKGEMYVFDRNKMFAEDHNQDMVNCFFGDECEGRGYFHRVIFAGVRTPYRDCEGQEIYTGDVIDVNDGEMKLALSTLGYNEDGMRARYAFVLDNHSLFPEDCKKMKRVGTIFYQLTPWDTVSVAQRAGSFQGCYPSKIPQSVKRIMAKFTPNFDQESWKYEALEILGTEKFNW